MQETKTGRVNRDIMAKEIFDIPELCAQFLRGYADVPLFKNVQAQDIEEMKERYHFFNNVEFNSDIVKKIRIHESEDGENIPCAYLVTLIEHKSKIDYNVAMQLLRYMVCIWYDWEKERVSQCRRKDFRYPAVIPIVYYNGVQKWTAEVELKNRIYMSDVFEKYIPNFTCRIISSSQYTDEELLRREDEVSLMMLIGKIRNPEDFEKLRIAASGAPDRIVKKASETVLNAIEKAVQSVCEQMNVPVEETVQYLQGIRRRNMGAWVQIKNVDVQADRRKAAEAKQKAAEAEQKAAMAEQKAIEAEQKATEAEQKATEAEQKATEAEQKLADMQIKFLEEQKRNLVETCRQLSGSRKEVIAILAEKLKLSKAEAEKTVEKYWN